MLRPLIIVLAVTSAALHWLGHDILAGECFAAMLAFGGCDQLISRLHHENLLLRSDLADERSRRLQAHADA